ncbi:Elongation factor 1-beta [Penicillium sp. IBT 31633x]|nr:Elongation factor 1-beta [Penicillium sp. IBT 31633x]
MEFATMNKRLEEYKAKKTAKPTPAANPEMTKADTELEINVHAIKVEGPVWDNSHFVDIGIGVVVEDEKVPLDAPYAQIEEDKDHVHSTDVAAMQKL